jgi:opacity protein-like surface antigen
MKTKMKWAAGSLVMLLSIAGVVRAEDNKNVVLSLMGGAAKPVSDGILGDLGGKFGTAPAVKASLMWQATPVLGLGLEAGYALHPEEDFFLPGIGNAFGLTYKRTVLQVTPEIQLGSWMGIVKPYLTLGGGLYRIHEEIGSFLFSPLKTTHNYAGINAGGGLLIKIADNVAFGPDIRYHRILTSDDAFHYVDATIRLALSF